MKPFEFEAVVLLSGGQDSTTCLYWAIKEFGVDNVAAISFRYGQRHGREIEQAQLIANQAGIGGQHEVYDLDFLGAIGDSALTDKNKELLGSGGRPDEHCPDGLPTSFVPGRNILLLTCAASYAASLKAKYIVTGVCQTDYSGYPDCRREFVDSLEATWKIGLGVTPPLRIITPLMNLTKAETVKMARELGDDCWTAIGHSLTCYEGHIPGCGTCPACDLRLKGFAEAGETDPQLDR